MNKNCRLCNSGLFKFISSSSKHDIGDLKPEDIIGLIKQSLRLWLAFINILSHSSKLRALSWKNVCFHIAFLFKWIHPPWRMATKIENKIKASSRQSGQRPINPGEVV